MALATKCPHCNTIFRVAHDQLKLRGGIVRCGSCNEVFDGNAALLEPLAAPATAPVPVQLPSPLPEPVAFDEKMAALDTRAAEALSGDEAEPIYTLELDTALDAVEPAEAAEPPEAADAPAVEAAAPLDAEPADTIALPTEAATLPPAVEAALDLDLDVEAESESAIEPEPTIEPTAEPAVDTQWTDDEPLEDALSIEAMSDEELEAALAAELAVLEQDNTEPAADTAPAPDAFTSVLPTERLEPTLDDAPPADTTAVPSEAARFNELEEIDEEALVQLSSAGLAEAQSARAHAHLLADAADTDAGSGTDTDSPDTEAEEPGFIKRERRRQKYGKAATIAMSLGSLLLLTTLAAQGLTTFRNQIAAALPPLKPALTAACNALGCKIELPAQIDDLSIEQGELQTLSDTGFSFTTQLRNQSATAQAWPHIELVLDDANDKAVLRRVFTPREYLGADVALDKGFAPHTEQSVKLYFELSQLKASGYHIAVFYP
ncbi:DUF3426 domain-containing protein [Rugamonas rivuli]|uniref:DUF3426 domain-containing protein n=1 Tax=Rugamonas rivuli TaxID=2743358 RepID=A0A843SKU0_9BURK|nr:DUF3426 domain-containing protein [Rugamonas rivuli]MQA21377.1 DUF3426 domain-containing protein [Rugamonas rivuli]